VVESSKVTGRTAIVKIKETRFYEGGLFDSNEYTNYFDMTLRQDSNGDWKITEADEYWLYCWNTVKGCD
jgi:hypothetical protein